MRFTGTRDAEAAGISIIHQELNLVEQLSAAANIFLGREIRGWLGFRDDRAMEQAAGPAAQRAGVRDSTRGNLAGSLRVGDQQLIEIAKALSLQSDILIMDEPTSALTEAEVSRLYRVIERLRKRRRDDPLHLAQDGRGVSPGRPHHRPPRRPAGEDARSRKETTPKEVTHLMVGREIEAIDFGGQRQAGEVLLQVENLSLPWPGHARGWRLKDVSFELRRGEVLGIAGLMGAGRTELLECLFGAAAERPHGPHRAARPAGHASAIPAKPAPPASRWSPKTASGWASSRAMNVGENISICTLDETGAAGFINRTPRMATGRGHRRRSWP